MKHNPTLYNLLTGTALKDDEQFHVYLLRPDGWPWGYHGAFRDPDITARLYDFFLVDPEIIGIWIMKESNDGTTGKTIVKTYINGAYST